MTRISRRQLLTGGALFGSPRIKSQERQFSDRIMEQYLGNNNAVIGIVDGEDHWVNFNGFTVNPNVQNPFDQDRYSIFFYRNDSSLWEFGIGNRIVIVGNYLGQETRGGYEGRHVLDAEEIFNLDTQRGYRLRETWNPEKRSL